MKLKIFASLIIVASMTALAACNPYHAALPSDKKDIATPGQNITDLSNGGTDANLYDGGVSVDIDFPTPDRIRIHSLDSENYTITGLNVEGEAVSEFFNYDPEVNRQFKHVSVKDIAKTKKCNLVLQLEDQKIVEAFVPTTSMCGAPGQDEVCYKQIAKATSAVYGGADGPSDLDFQFHPGEFSSDLGLTLNEGIEAFSSMICNGHDGLSSMLYRSSKDVKSLYDSINEPTL